MFTPKILWPISISLLLYIHVRSKEQSFQFCSFVKYTCLYQSVNESSFIYTHKKLMLWISSKAEERFGTKDDSNRSYCSLKETDTADILLHREKEKGKGKEKKKQKGGKKGGREKKGDGE